MRCATIAVLPAPARENQKNAAEDGRAHERCNPGGEAGDGNDGHRKAESTGPGDERGAEPPDPDRKHCVTLRESERDAYFLCHARRRRDSLVGRRRRAAGTRELSALKRAENIEHLLHSTPERMRPPHPHVEADCCLEQTGVAISAHTSVSAVLAAA